MKKIQLLVVGVGLLLGSVISSFAQTKPYKITGMVIDGQKKPLEAATISILNAKDSGLVKMALTNKEGYFEVENLPEGKYLVTASSVAFQKKYSNAIELNAQKPSVETPVIQLTEIGRDLGGVTVTSKKLFVEQKLGKTVVNVEAMASNVGLTVLEILEKSPGISVDKDGNISLKGKQGVSILIDGKPSYLSGQDLANLLKSMPSSQLEQLEIMTNPPAKYDASGNSGVINLKTKKNKTQGLNGSFTLGAGLGVYPKSSNSANMNYRNGKWNVFGNCSYNYNKGFQNLRLHRNFRDKSTLNLLSIFEQQADMHNRYEYQSLKIGADFYANKNTTVGVLLNGYINPSINNNDNTTFILNNIRELDTKTLAASYTKQKWNNISANFNLRHQFDSTGTELTADLDYIGYNSLNRQDFSNLFFDRDGNKKAPDEFAEGNLPSDIKIYSGKVDFSKPLNKTAKLEAGIKSSYVKTDNNALYQNLVGSNWETDLGRTNHFVYKENINAAYINTSKEFNKTWSAQLGFRLENTNAKGKQLTTGRSFNRKYTQLFPTAYIGYNLNEKNQFSLSYGRRIERPDYEDMNPFYYFLDKYTYQVGNPYLRPQFTHNIELTHTYGGFLTTTLNYSTTKDIITQVLDQIDSTNTTFVNKDNIASQKNIGLIVNLGIPITKWWRTNISTNIFNNQYSGIVNGGNVKTNATSWMVNISNQFTFKKEWGAEISGFYRSRAVEGVIIAQPMGVINLAVSKQVLKKQATIKLNFKDPFNLQMFRGYSKYQNIDIDIRNNWDNRIVNVSFIYRLGKPIKGLKQRKSGSAADEQNRVKTAQ